MNSLSKKGIDLMKYIDTTVFWEDKWCEEGVLKDRRNPRGGYELDQFKNVEELVRLVSLASISNRVETSRHLFFSCGMAREVVNLITRWWNVSNSDFDSYEECLSTLHFLKLLENIFEVLKLLENSVEVLKILENKLESMKILENKLKSLKLQVNQPVDGLVHLFIKKLHPKVSSRGC
nr:RNA-directed DNA polymerase, eukaryota [Tanacetum cinerariifolium]